MNTTSPKKPVTAGAIFLFCFIVSVGVTRIFYGIVEPNTYETRFMGSGRFPTPAGLSSLGQDFAFAWNAARNLESPTNGLYHKTECHSPNNATCGHCFPPMLPLLYMVFGHFDPYTAYRLYVVFIMVCWLVALYALSRNYAFTAPSYILLIAMVTLSFQSHMELERGQQYTPILVPVFLGFYLLRRHRDALAAAVLISLAVLMKVFPAIFVVYFGVKRQYRFCIFSALFLVIFVLATGGFEFWRQYAHNLAGYVALFDVMGGAVLSNHSTLSSILMLFGLRESTEGFKLAAQVVNLGMTAATLGYIFFMRIERTGVLLSLELAMIMILANIIPQIAYHYTLVVCPFVAFAVIGALDHPAVRQLLGKRWVAVTTLLGLMSGYLLFIPVGYHLTPIDRVLMLVGIDPIYVLRYPWVYLVLFWMVALWLHWVIARSPLNDESRDDASGRPWWRRWLVADFGDLPSVPLSFEKGKRLASLSLLVDGAGYSRLWRGLMVRFGAFALIAYVLILSGIATFIV